MQSESSFSTTYSVIHKAAECNSGSASTGGAGQSTPWRTPLSKYVSIEDCQKACDGDDTCNGMIEYGSGICASKRLNRLTGNTECVKNDEQCTKANACTCYLVTGTCSHPTRHPRFNILKASKHPEATSSFSATCEHKDRCGWSPAGGVVSADRTKVTMTNGFRLTGILSNDGKEISWSNHAYWTRISDCGSFGHELLPLRIPKGSFSTGSSLTCTGVWPTGDKRFSLNFMAGNDVALHVNPRDSYVTGGKTWKQVVRNTRVNGRWQKQEEDGQLPLRHDAPFKLRVTAGREDFRITFEGDGSVGDYGGTGSFGLYRKGAECSNGHDKDQSVLFYDQTAGDHYVSFNQCESGCLAEKKCKGMIEFGLSPGRCKGVDQCLCYLVVGECSKPVAHKSYSVYKLGAPARTKATFTYKYRIPLAKIDRITSEDGSLQYCDLNEKPSVPLFTKTFQGKKWTLVRRVKQGPSWHPATDELLGTDEYGTYCGQRGAAKHCDTSDATFSIPFGDNGRSSLHWDQIMFSSGDNSLWLIMDKAEMDRCTDGKNNGQWHPKIAQASGHSAPYSVTQYCRHGNEVSFFTSKS